MKEPNDITLPISAEETIKLLDETFPEKCADLSMEINEIWFKSGQSSVVSHLKQILNDDENNILNKKVIGDIK